MKVNVNRPGYVLAFAAIVSTLFTGAIMTLHAISASAAAEAARVYKQKALVQVFELDADQPRPLSDVEIGRLYREHIRPYDKLLRDPQTGKVFNDPDPNAGPLAPRTYVARTSEGEIIGYALPVSGIGFWSQIDGYLAVQPEFAKAIGVVFIRHQETPGLGGRITEPRWRKQFDGLDITKTTGGQYIYIGGDRPESKDDPKFGHYVDAITGATGTSTAVDRFMNKDIAEFRRAAVAAGLIEGPATNGAERRKVSQEPGSSVGDEGSIADCRARASVGVVTSDCDSVRCNFRGLPSLGFSSLEDRPVPTFGRLNQCALREDVEQGSVRELDIEPLAFGVCHLRSEISDLRFSRLGGEAWRNRLAQRP